MLKSFLEMRNIDVTPYCDIRKGKDDNGRVIDIPYLSWVKCLTLLYENGAERVEYRPLATSDGGFLLKCEESVNVSKDKSRESGCYFVVVQVTIDDRTYTMPYPVMNGTAVVYKDTLNQLRVSNAIQRAFVKCVAVNTGLGIKLWEKDDETSDRAPVEEELEITPAVPLLVKDAIGKMLTERINRGKLPKETVLEQLGIKERNLAQIYQFLDNASWLIGALQRR